MDYSKKSYGRNAEVEAIYHRFSADKDLNMAGPRRLGKTFVLDRLVESAAPRGWVAVKVEVGGCNEPRSFFREMCGRIGSVRSGGEQVIAWLRQRLGQIAEPRTEPAGDWYQPLISLDHESYFERLVELLNADKTRRWALLIDELPIFLKALHDQGPSGVDAARNFMNLSSRLRARYPRVRWMITGSIGIEPLARAGNYLGVLAKFEPFDLQPLNDAEAREFVQDIAQAGRLLHRKRISDPEAEALVRAVGWRAAYYLEALAMKLDGEPSDDVGKAEQAIEQAMQKLLAPAEAATFGVWEEHLRKHYRDSDQRVAFAVLAALAESAAGLSLDSLLPAIGINTLTRAELRTVLGRLAVDGFISMADWDGDNPTVAFLNPLLRRWWHRHSPQVSS